MTALSHVEATPAVMASALCYTLLRIKQQKCLHDFEKKSGAGSTGWFKFNDGKLFPDQSPRRFFESGRLVLHTSYMSPYEDRT